MTIGIRENCIHPERKLLLPLESGLITYEILHNCLPLENRQQLEIKWPNDIHLKERKVCGLLLEKHEGRYFIGIGINIIQAPHLAVGMRPSGRLADFGLKLQDNKSLIHDIYNAFKEKTREIRSPEQVLKKWKQHICWNKPVTLRQNPESPVIPVDVSPDGMLAVRLPDGSVKWLRTEYLS